MGPAQGEELVRLRIDGPGGDGLVLLQKDMPLSVLKRILDEKLSELRAQARLPESERPKIAPEERGEILKLSNWVNEQEAKLASLTLEQRKRLEELSEKQMAARQQTAEKDLEKLRQEELKGKRIVIYDAPDNVLSVSEASSKEQLQLVQKYLGHQLTDEQAKQIDSWITKAKSPKSKDADEVIELQREDSNEPLRLSEKSNPDILRAVVAEHALTASQTKKIDLWISNSPKGEKDKIRVFHNGADFPEQSSEINLTLHGKQYCDELYKQLAEGAYLLPEHKTKLDQHYAKLEAGKAKEQDFFEIPSELPGRFTYIRKDEDKEVLQVVLDTRKEILPPDLSKQIQDAIASAKEPGKKGSIRVYDMSDPSSHVSLRKNMTPEEMDKQVDSLEANSIYIRKEDASLLMKVMPSPSEMSSEPIRPTIGDAILAKHKTGISLTIDDELMSRHPEQIIEILHDDLWALKKADRDRLRNSVEGLQTEKDIDDFQYQGEVYSKNSSLAKLKGLAERIAEDETNELSPENSKKLLTWMTKKEKQGDKEARLTKASIDPNQEKHLHQRTEQYGRLRSLLNVMQANQSQTVDGYYSEIWGADKSALAAGPRGAASGGLRPMGIWQFTEILSSAMRDHLYSKQLQDHSQQLTDLQQEAKKALVASKDKGEPSPSPIRFGELGHGSGLMSDTEKQIHRLAKEKIDIAVCQIYNSIQQFKTQEMNRKPNRDNKKIEEIIPPGPGAFKGPGGFGGMA